MSDAQPAFDPTTIVAVLDRFRVRYVLVGGFAAQLHGAGRPTTDMDVTPLATRQNLGRLAQALKELGAGIRVDDLPDGLPFDTSADALAGMTMLNLRTVFGDLDITFNPSGTEGFDDIARSAEPRTVGGVVVNVASLADIIRSKEAAGRPKDLAALPELMRLARERPPG